MNHTFKILITILLVGATTNSYAYNSNKCDKTFRRFGGFAGSIYSTSSYFTSTGDCAMIGQTEHDQKLFLAMNLDHIKIDAARGAGEYLISFAHLAKLTALETKAFSKFIQKNYTFIFKDNDIDRIYNRIKSVNG